MQWQWSPAVKFVTLKWLVLRLSWQPPQGASAYIHYWSLQEAASVKIRNPERRVLNMYHALVVILRDFTPPAWRKVAFEGCFVWGRQVRLFFFHLSLQGASITESHFGLLVVLSSSPPAVALSLCLQWNHFQTWFQGFHFSQFTSGAVEELTLPLAANKTLMSEHFSNQWVSNLISSHISHSPSEEPHIKPPRPSVPTIAKSLRTPRSAWRKLLVWQKWTFFGVGGTTFAHSNLFLYSLEGSWELNSPSSYFLRDSMIWGSNMI